MPNSGEMERGGGGGGGGRGGGGGAGEGCNTAVAWVLTKVGKPNQDSEKNKGLSCDFHKKTHFKL